MTDHSVPPRPTTMGPNTSEIPSNPHVRAKLGIETPTEEIVRKKQSRTAEVVDEFGRAIQIKFVSPLDRMRLAKIIGAADAGNDVYMGYATLAFMVTHIDGEPIVTNSVREIEFLVERLGDEGLNAVGKGITENFSDLIKRADRDAAKN